MTLFYRSVLLTSVLSYGLSITSVGASEQQLTPIEDRTKGTLPSSYDAGYNLGIQLAKLKKQQPHARLDDAIAGLCEALAKTRIRIDKPGLCDSNSFSDKARVSGKHLTSRQQQPIHSGGNRSLDDFAMLNARREGVVVLPSTVQYEVLKQGKGNSPAESDTVLVNYQASLPDGRIFDTTYEEEGPIPLLLSDIASPGLTEALMMMRVGDQWRVVIPPKMGFARSGNNRLRRHVLIYEIELVSIQSAVAR